jgi:2-methylcitrate dehydratase PrpD
MAGLTETIAHFIAENSLATIPSAAIDKAKKAIADTFAVILAGAGSEVAPPLMRYLEQAGGSGESPILGTALSSSPEIAALINGTFGHALDFDDVLSIMPAHPSAVILPALLADAGKHTISGTQLLEAYMIGIEVGAKIGVAMTVGHYNRGFHGTGTLGIFSAMGALSKLHELDPETMRIAFGIASSLASGLRRNFGTMTKPLHTGWAARSAVVATNLAQCGFTAAPDILEAKAGYFAAYGVDASDPEVAIRGLGRPWVMIDPGIALKYFPCCYATHRGMDGVLQLRQKLGFTADTLQHLECRMPPGGMRVLTYPRPTTGLEGKFSLQYSLAAGVLDGRYTLWSFTDAAVNRPEISELLKKIEAKEVQRCGGDDPLLETRSSGSRGFVEVEATTTDGRKDVIRIVNAPGHPSRELGWKDLEAKFMDCAMHAPIDKNNAERAFERLNRLDDCADVNDIVRLLTLR